MQRPVIPDHALLRPIGRGAYGEVWLARNVMGTLRAVKIIWRRQFESERPFQREFEGIQRYEPVARSSGGLVHVLQIGRNEAEEYFYYVMELADPVAPEQTNLNSEGYVPRTLRSDLKRNGRLPIGECLRLAVDVVSGLAQLHRRGLVHRDVKPGNIIYVSGRAKLADIGLVSTGGEGRTFVGTEGYIPPEGPGSAAADLYALGMVLYEASTGFAPERFPDVPPDWMSASAGDEPLEFYEVALKACEGQRNLRYQNAEEMQADLALLQSGQSVHQMRALKRRYARLRRSGLIGAALIVCAIAMAVVAQYRAKVAAEVRTRETALRKETEQALVRMQAAERESQKRLYSAWYEQARTTVRSGELGQRVHSLDAVRRAAGISNTVELRQEAFAALGLPDLRFEREIPTGFDCPLAELDPKFERVALGRDERPVEIRSVPDLRLLEILPVGTNQTATLGRWSRDGRFLALRRTKGMYIDPEVEVWEVARKRSVLWLPRTAWNAFSLHPVASQILGGADDSSAAIWDLENGTVVKRFPMGGQVQSLEFSPDGEQFTAQRKVGSGWVTSIFDVGTGAESKTVKGPRFNTFSWDPGGRWIALTANNQVHLHDQKSGETLLLGRHNGEARSATFSHDGQYLFTGGDEQEIICWDLRSKERAFSIGLQSDQLRFRSDGGQCVVSTSHGLLLHRFERPTAHRELTGDLGGELNNGAISPDGRWLAVGGRDRLGLWDLKEESPQAVTIDAKGATPFFSPDSSELLAFWNDGFARWHITLDAEHRPKVRSLTIYKPGRIYSAAFAADSFVLGMPEGLMTVPIARIETGPGALFEVGYAEAQISPDGKWAALRKGNQRYVDIYLLKPFASYKFEECDAYVVANAFTPHSDELAIATLGSIRFLNTGDWHERRRFPVSLARTAKLIFTPNGDSFWLAQNARTAALHDTQTFETLLPLPLGMIPLAVSSDGEHLVVSVDMHRVQLWDLAEVRRNLKELGLDREK